MQKLFVAGDRLWMHCARKLPIFQAYWPIQDSICCSYTSFHVPILEVPSYQTPFYFCSNGIASFFAYWLYSMIVFLEASAGFFCCFSAGYPVIVAHACIASFTEGFLKIRYCAQCNPQFFKVPSIWNRGFQKWWDQVALLSRPERLALLPVGHLTDLHFCYFS